MDEDSRGPEDDAADDGPMSVPDEGLPDDLKPGEDNPLAQPADDDVPDDLLAEEAGSTGSGGGPEDASQQGNDDAPGGDATAEEAPSGTESDS